MKQEVQLVYLESFRPVLCQKEKKAQDASFGRKTTVWQNSAHSASNPFFPTRVSVPSRAMQPLCLAMSGLGFIVIFSIAWWQTVICRARILLVGRKGHSANSQTTFEQIEL